MLYEVITDGADGDPPPAPGAERRIGLRRKPAAAGALSGAGLRRPAVGRGAGALFRNNFV